MTDGARVRIAPSPTGDPHVGTAYIALFNYVFARKTGGKFVLRIEDTDRVRSRHSSEVAIIEALRWVGLDWDEGPDKGGPYGPYRQSERAAIYREHADILISSGKAYRCFCTPERLTELRKEQMKAKQNPGYDGLCRGLDAAESKARADAGDSFVVRLATPESGVTKFTDRLRGEVEISNQQIDDQVLMKSDGFPTYHLANVVDDHLMKISHVVRAEEWISSTPKHVMLYDAFGWEQPTWIHMPLLRNPDRSKISKRKNPVSINYYQRAGFLPKALLNFLGIMGWSFGDDREKFTLDEMTEVFDWDKVSLGGPVFNVDKLRWMNEQYIHDMSDEELADALIEWRLGRDHLVELMPLYRERIKQLSDFVPGAQFFYAGDLDYEPVADKMKIPEVPGNRIRKQLLALVEAYEAAPSFDAESLEKISREFCEHHEWKTKHGFMLLRYAVSGRKASPGLFETMVVLGKEMTIRRLRQAADVVKRHK
ncbi:MAG: glutamate--tRNA ligase [Deltaproteobacteria bacterium]|nr:glutamate--tRNA ligase [Deltaproteobacteria bacterium]